MSESFKLKNDDHYSIIIATVCTFILICVIYLASSGFTSFTSPYVLGAIGLCSALISNCVLSYFSPNSFWRFVPLFIAMLIYLLFAVGFSYYSLGLIIDDVPNTVKDFMRILACTLLLWDCKRRIKKHFFTMPESKSVLKSRQKKKERNKKKKKKKRS